MSNIEIVAYCIGVTIIFGVVYRWLTQVEVSAAGKPASTAERAAARLAVAGPIARAMVIINALFKLAVAVGWVQHSLQELLVPALGIPLFLSCVAYLKAIWDVKRSPADSA